MESLWGIGEIALKYDLSPFFIRPTSRYPLRKGRIIRPMLPWLSCLPAQNCYILLTFVTGSVVLLLCVAAGHSRKINQGRTLLEFIQMSGIE